MRSLGGVSFAWCLWMLATTALALGTPKLIGHVNDYADLLSPTTEARLEDTLAKLEQDQGAQVAVLTIDSLQGEGLEDYSLRVAETWALGRKDQDDGALLLIAKDDRKTRLEVGYGLEPVLTDVMSRRILDHILRPRFRSGDFDGGVERAIEAIDGLVRGTSTPPLVQPATHAQERILKVFGTLWMLSLVPFMLVLVGTKPFQWVLYVFLVPFVFVGGLTLAGPDPAPSFVGVWLLGAPLLWALVGRRRKSRGKGRRRSAAGWAAGAWSAGGTSSRGWSSGGGFSGGGGSFGGGGSSGSW